MIVTTAIIFLPLAISFGFEYDPDFEHNPLRSPARMGGMGLIDTREGVYQDRSRVLTNKYADIFLPCDVLERAARISITNNLDTAVLRGATVFGGIDIVRGLLHKGADVNARHTDGFTLLMLAACNGDIEIVKLLINQGADVSAVNKDGKTACMLASEKGHKLVAEFIANLARGVRRLDLRQPP